MGKFTESENPLVDQQIELQLKTIVNIIREKVPRVRSILLAGSFGRGEGSVEIVGNRVVPLKDYDICAIVDKLPRKALRNLLNKEITSTLDLLPDLGSKFTGFHVDVSFYTIFRLESYLDIVLWELKHASILLYGEDVRSVIPWKIEDIPLFNGLRFLFEKATGLTAYFSEEYAGYANIDEQSLKLLTYECFKTYVEIVSVLCLAMGCYEPSYKKRLFLFTERFKKELAHLSERVPTLEEYAIKGTNFKLKPEFVDVEENISDLWFQTRDVLCEVFKYYFKKSLDVEVSSFIESYEELQDALAPKYYLPVVRAALVAHGVRSEFIARIMNYLFLSYQKFSFVFRFAAKKKRLYLRPIFQGQSPLMTIYLASIPVILSLTRNGELDPQYFQCALKNLRKVIPIKTKRVKSWNDLRDLYVKVYEMNRGGAK